MPAPRFVRAAATVDGVRNAARRSLREQPDVCLLDIQMGASGTAAAATINARVPGAVVVMLTARATTTTSSPR
jgi:DNA-binding NarL/FixJ family response regulator